MRIDIAIFDGVDELDVVGPLEVFRSAQSLGAGFDSRLVTRTETQWIRGSYGLNIKPDSVYRAGEADVLVVPGGGWAARNEIGAWGEVQRGQWLPLLRAARETCSLMCGVCTGTMILAHAGLVAGRRAGTHRSAQQDLASMNVDVVDERVVDDGDLVTSGGVTSGIDLALWIVEREASADIADRVAFRMQYTRSRPR